MASSCSANVLVTAPEGPTATAVPIGVPTAHAHRPTARDGGHAGARDRATPPLGHEGGWRHPLDDGTRAHSLRTLLADLDTSLATAWSRRSSR
jgi:hypothetical protein